MAPEYRRLGLPRAIAAALIVLGAVSLCVGCSPKSHTEPQASSATPRNVTLTNAQRQKIHLYAIAPSKFRTTIESTGKVDFDNDQATSILAPFSGPVSRLLVSAGDKVSKGQPLAVVESADFAAA